ncbi:hypothetical protein NL676_035451 [Syzygium grande]|nr:hypothetical protein NL676_035451 [Syzygium grande]
MSELLESKGKSTSLQKLDISETSIVELPDWIKNLKQLKVLRMGRSPIRRFPASIGMLERLEELDAKGCEQLAGELPTGIGGLSSLSILNISYTRVCAVPMAINSLARLQKLALTSCNELQELPKLPSSLNCLRVYSTSLQVLPDLSNLTNLVKLLLSNGFGPAPGQASNPMQNLQLQWVGKLSKLEKLIWGLSDVPVSSTELGCLPRLRQLNFSGMDIFNSVAVAPQLSNLKYLSILRLIRSPLREIQLDGLQLLRELTVQCCEFLEGLSVISSSLRNLLDMHVTCCPKLLEIRFLSTMESLEEDARETDAEESMMETNDYYLQNLPLTIGFLWPREPGTELDSRSCSKLQELLEASLKFESPICPVDIIALQQTPKKKMQSVENVCDIGHFSNVIIISALCPPFARWFTSHHDPPVAILSDFFLGWTLDLADKLDVH